MPKRKYSDWRDAAIEKLEARIAKLEAGPNLTQLSKLSLAPGDMLTLHTPKDINRDELFAFMEKVNTELGFKVALVHTFGEHKLGLLKRQEP